MYQPFSDQRLRVMTAADGLGIPSLDTVRRLPTIRMDLVEQYKAEKIRANALEILRNSAKAPTKGFMGFERQLPDVITGQNQDWRLWRVDFYVAYLKLYYVEAAAQPEAYYRTGGTSPDSVGHFRSCAYAYLISPTTIGLDFELSEMDWRISYEMTSSSPTGAHTVKLTESFGGEPAGSFTYSVQHVSEFQP